jgi:hypothetical protein
MTSLTMNRAPDATYIVYSEPRFEADPTSWMDLPGATIPLKVGQGTPSYGAVFVATFSSEAIAEASDNNAVFAVTVFFGGQQAEPASDNHRYVTARGGPEWSSHTFIRTIQFDVDISVRDATAQVRLSGSSGLHAGIQNWVLKVERYNL